MRSSFILILGLSFNLFFSQVSETEAVKAGVNKLFTAMKDSDSAGIKSSFTKQAILQTIMKTGTLEVINKIWDFRRITGLPLFFTLDAGANVHLLFPNDIESDKIKIFIQQELLPFTQKGGVVKDEMRF